MATTVEELICRRFTSALDAPENAGKTVYDLFEWSKRDVHLTDYKTGKTLCEMHDLEFPVQYSQNAVDIIASKYFRRAGVPETGHEVSMRQVAHRMVDFWVAALIDEGMVEEGEQAQVLYDELVYLILDQRFAPNSPQWFNTGLKRSYGIAGEPQEMYYVDPESGEVVESIDQYTRTQASACFIVSVQDKLLGDHSISDEYVTETKLFKGGSGTGSNFSALRAEGEKLSGGGVSSGVMSFLRGLDRNADAIKSGGTTRRAAKMVCLDIDHPDIEKFITWKSREEDKALALMKMGYDGDINGEAYATVSGQNSNNSLRIDNEFMAKVMALPEDPDVTYELKGRVDPSFNREVSVKHIWDVFNESAWRCADPAPQFSDTFNEWHTCPGGEDGVVGASYNRLNSTNPCGEYAFLDDSSCNLASINVFRYYDPATDTFDVEGFEHTIDVVQLALEASIAWGQFPTKDIARKTYRFRATGLGISNLASLLMAKGMPYDSREARALASAIVGTLTGRSYAVSAIMARKVGPFECYGINRRYMERVIRNHARVAGARNDAFEDLTIEPPVVDFDLLEQAGEGELASALIESWTFAEELGERYGYRNAQVSVMAPTGTISFAMDCAATSIEPFFSHMIYKKLSGGGFMTIANPVIGDALRHLGYTEDEVADILAYVQATDENGMIVDGKIEGAPHLKPEHLAIFDTANVCGTGERYIAPRGHVLMVAALTPLVSGAISKTVNLPREATVQDFKDVITLAWQTGCKGITLYRDGSKNAQPLNTSLTEDTGEKDLGDLSYAALLEYARGAQQQLRLRRAAGAPPPHRGHPQRPHAPRADRRREDLHHGEPQRGGEDLRAVRHHGPRGHHHHGAPQLAVQDHLRDAAVRHPRREHLQDAARPDVRAVRLRSEPPQHQVRHLHLRPHFQGHRHRAGRLHARAGEARGLGPDRRRHARPGRGSRAHRARLRRGARGERGGAHAPHGREGAGARGGDRVGGHGRLLHRGLRERGGARRRPARRAPLRRQHLPQLRQLAHGAERYVQGLHGLRYHDRVQLIGLGTAGRSGRLEQMRPGARD